MKWLVLAAALVAFTADLSVAEVTVATVIPMENSFYELECPHEGEMAYWLMHSKGKALYPTETLIEEESITIFKNGSMIFMSVKVEYAGVHLCVRKHQDTHVGHPVPLQVRPLPPKDLWGGVYRGQFLTGLVAAIVCFLLFTVSCFVYNRRWRPEEKESDVHPIVENGYDNPAMVGGEEDSSSTKM